MMFLRWHLTLLELGVGHISWAKSNDQVSSYKATYRLNKHTKQETHTELPSRESIAARGGVCDTRATS
jgi:hypothetical protein